MSPKLLRVTAEVCGLDDAGRVDVYNRCLEQLRLAEHCDGVIGENAANANRISASSNIYERVLRILSELEKCNAPTKTVNFLTIYGLSPVLFYFTANAKSLYNKGLLDEFSDKIRSFYEDGRFSITTFRYFLKAVRLLRDYCGQSLGDSYNHPKQGIVKLDRQRRTINNHNEHLLSLYVESIRKSRTLTDRTIKSNSCSIRAFLSCLEKLGINSVEEYSHAGINDSITEIASWYGGGLRSTIYAITQFLRFLHEQNLTSHDFSLAIPKTPPRRRKIFKGFSKDEQSELLDAVAINTSKGKRDYAIMLLAASSGLRAVDIANLKLEDIDWRTNEIKIIQSKTNNPLALPLMPEAGNAVAEYILNARPKSESRFVFTYHKRGDKLQGQTVGAVVRKYARITDVAKNHERTGIHGFRRGFGKMLLESQTPIDMINELLGHLDVNSSKPYLAIDEAGLKHCAISLSHVSGNDFCHECKGGVA